jgi:hypothetical protein
MKFIYSLLFFFLFISLELSAQPGPPPPDPDEPVPLQGFVFLIIAGAALGIKSIIGNIKRDKN